MSVPFTDSGATAFTRFGDDIKIHFWKMFSVTLASEPMILKT